MNAVKSMVENKPFNDQQEQESLSEPSATEIVKRQKNQLEI